MYGPDNSSPDSDRWYCFRPRDVEPIAYNGWVRYRPATAVAAQSPASESAVEPLWYDMDVGIDSFAHIEFQVEGRYLVTAPSLDRIFFDFSPVFAVHEVTDVRKQALDFWVEPARGGPQGILVFLSRQFNRSDTLVLRFAYDGSPAIATSDGTFYLPCDLRWYPTVSPPAPVPIDARFTFPATMSVVASGRRIREQDNGPTRRSFWVFSSGTPDFTFAFGDYGTRDYFYEGIPRVTVFTPRLLPDRVAADSLKDIVGDVLNGLGYFQKLFGPFPFGSLAVGEVPGAQHAVFGGLIHLPHRAFDPSSDGEPSTDCGHGVAAQWWKYMLPVNSYRDQWFIEGVAEYSAGLYLEKSRKRKDLFSAAVGSWRDKVNTGCDAPAAGPLILGRRLPERYLLARSAYAMHMLRMMMADLDIDSDRRFLAMLRDFLEYYRGRVVTTQDFLQQAELYYGEPLDWFFRQWVYGTDIPAYTVRHEIERQSDGKYWVRLEVEQTGVDGQFKMPVPVAVTFPRGRPYRSRVWVVGAKTTARLGPFEYRPQSIVFNDRDAVLTRRTEAADRIAETPAPR